MIVVQLKGGLGNQLFQYAAGLSLAHHHRTTVKVDISELNQQDADIGTYRAFDLEQLRLPPQIASLKEIAVVKPFGFQRLFDKLRSAHKRREYSETDFCFDTHFFEAGNTVYLKGYRQSEKYFQPIADIIREGFQFREEVIASVVVFGATLPTYNSVAIHIRRGDYNKPQVQDYHGVMDAAYYQQAIDMMEAHYSDARFYIFTDDAAWVQQTLHFQSPVQLVSGNISQTHFHDMYLISQCRHQVIANSTFSWWAAWLNNYQQKTVIAPRRWFNNAPHDTKDLLPTSWIKI